MIARRHLLAGGGALVVLALTGCGGAAPEADAPARRIVAVGSDVTEILFALGLDAEVIAVDETSFYPPAVNALPKVGYLRALSAEGVVGLGPTTVVAGGDAGPDTALQQMQDTGVEIVRTRTARTPEDVVANIETIAAALGRESEGRALVERFRADMDRVQTEVAALGDRPRALFLLAINTGSPNAAGSETAADAMIALAGGDNAVTAYPGYRALSPEAAVAARPDVVLMMSHALDAAGGADAVAANPAIAATPAGRAGRIVSLDGGLHLGFGPRLPEAVSSLARLMRG